MQDDASVGEWLPHDDVFFHLEVDGAQWTVVDVSISEELNVVPTCTVTARAPAGTRAADLLHKECALRVDRQAEGRGFKGVVWHAQVFELFDGTTTATLTITPAMAYLGARTDCRIFQDKTVVEVIDTVYSDALGTLKRDLQKDKLRRSYETREYIVQYRESALSFISRLSEEEGIFWYFEYDGERETLILADTSSSLEAAKQSEVEFHPSAHPVGEVVTAIRPDEHVGTTDVVVTGYDWTQPTSEVRGAQTERSSHRPALESFHHANEVVYHHYSGRKYGENTASVQAQLLAERTDLERKRWSMDSTVAAAQAGRTITLSGAPDGLDQCYLISSAFSHGHALESAGGSWTNTLDVVPTSMPYRPPRMPKKPLAYGPETATVVGSDEVETDEHGRVRVHFHWDRHHAREATDSSCWIRVAHHWAGPGYGTFFLPRVGMEVVVSFLGGDPDRPLVTGCVYNGDNASPAGALPDKKRHSVIRSKSSPNSNGYNELRLEDDAGSERIYFHAQRDYVKEVLHDRDVDVGHDERIHVHGARRAHVNGTERVEVDGERKKIQHANELETFEQEFESQYAGKRTELYGGKHVERLAGDRETTYEGGGAFTHRIDYKTAGMIRRFLGGNAYCVTRVAGTGLWQVSDLDQSAVWLSADVASSQVEVGAKTKIVASMLDESAKIELTQGNVEVKSDTVRIEANQKIELVVGSSTVRIEPGSISLESGGSRVDVSASGVVTSGSMTMVNSPRFVVAGAAVTRGGKPIWD